MNVLSTQRRDGVLVEDTRYGAAEGDVEAFLVRPVESSPSAAPEPGHPVAGILWWHWLDDKAPDGDRTEFLDEAIEWAGRAGVVSILPQGTYPWRQAPTSAAADIAQIQAEIARLRVGLDVLIEHGDASAERLAVVGHDFGAMHAMLALAEDPRPRGLVSIAATPRWGDWMLPFWPIVDDRITYLQTLEPYDPIERIGAIAPRPILLQHGERDFYIARMAGFGLRRAAGEKADLRFYDTEHDLRSEAAVADRRSFLETLLDLG